MDVRAEVVVLVPVSMATWMCCRCSDASWEHCAATVLTWATRANAQLTALSIRQCLFIAPKWHSGGTQAASSVGQGGQEAPKTGWVLVQDWIAHLDGDGWMRGETEGWTHGRGCVILSLFSVYTDKDNDTWPSVVTKKNTYPCFFEVFKPLHMHKVWIYAWSTYPQNRKSNTHTWWGSWGVK